MLMNEQRKVTGVVGNEIQRTSLANQRTLLAYEKTAVMFIAIGVVGVVLLGDRRPFAVLSWLVLVCGLIAAIIGIWRYASIRRKIANACKQLRN